VQQSEAFLERQRQAIHQAALKADVIIATAQVRGAKAPLLITAETIEMMRAGSVIVDLAASTGGNCAFTENNKTIQHKGVTIIGDSELSMLMSQDASVLFGNNLLNFLKLLIKNGEWAPEAENEIVKGSRIA
jgi:NAD(P) transhydrogenase subunit alpha